jgi:GT2 family glycosyltransferase
MRKTLRFTQHAAMENDFSCPLCENTRTNYIFHNRNLRVLRCTGCALTFSNHLFEKKSSDTPKSSRKRARLERTEKDHTSLIAALEELAISGPVLMLSDTDDEIIRLLGRRGITVTSVFNAEGFKKISAGRKFAAAIVSDAIMRVANPRTLLETVRRHLPAGAPLILSLPLLDGRQARLMGRNWHEWRVPNLWFLTRETLSLLLLAAGFEHIWFRTIRRNYSLNHLIERLRLAHDASIWFRALQALRDIFPGHLRNTKFLLPSGSAVVTASAAAASTETVVSIVVPVFNERKTFQVLFDALLAKQLSGIRKEIIVVESNSTDGSRDLVRAYENHPDVRVIYQPAPRGKGNAVREGLKAATGDILMIQDADLEYDLDDYESLLTPLLARQSMFVLGSRHQGEWKIRNFSEAPITAAIFNLGHSIFRTMINIAVNAKMADPFTMFKVLRRDSLYGLDFVCNRFDFDIELVIKLVRKGYTPLELPVNYVSRSVAEGKKVSVTRDALTWVLTILRARFSPLGGRRP